MLDLHGSRRGIHVTPRAASVLLDFGLSAYVNRRDGSRIVYRGEGLRGDQTPTGGNAALLKCHGAGRKVRVLERLQPGDWRDRGEHTVVSVEYLLDEREGRRVFEFVLDPAP